MRGAAVHGAVPRAVRLPRAAVRARQLRRGQPQRVLRLRGDQVSCDWSVVSWPQYSPLIGPQHHDPGAQHLLLRRGLHHGGLQVLQGGDQLSQLPPGGVPQ